MSAAVFTPRLVAAPLAAALAVGLGLLAGSRPGLAIAVAGVAVLVILPFVAPATHITLTVVVATLVPLDVQNTLSLSGGAGLVLVDVLLLAGLARAAVALLTRGIDRRGLRALVLVGLFLLLCVVQFAHGITLGHDPSAVGYEMRNLLGVGVLVIALPLVFDERGRRRLLVGMAIAGLAIGLWGSAQWLLEVGVPEAGVGDTGAVLGGEYAFGAIVVLAVAALVSTQRRPTAVTTMLAAVLVLNTIALVLTFQRAFWLATSFAVLLVVMRSERGRRARGFAYGGLTTLVVALTLSVAAPDLVSAARERLLSVGRYETDLSVRYRLRESSFVLREIRESAVAGSGLGATIYWGRPAEGVLPRSEAYSHDAYLWLAWKLGIPGLLLMLALVAFVLVAARTGRRQRESDGVRGGAVAALLGTLIVGVTAPVFGTLSASAVLGLLLALALAGDRQPVEDTRVTG